MSSIRSNSIGSVDIQDYRSLDQGNLLKKLTKIPIQANDNQSQEQINDDTSLNAIKKLNFMIQNFLLEIPYKSMLKQIISNLSALDEVKASNGLKSINKQIMKFNVFLKHHTLQQSRKVLAQLILKVLIGQE